MSTFGESLYGGTITCHKIIATEAELPSSFSGIIDVSGINLDNKWEIRLDASSNFILENTAISVNSIIGDAHTGKITFLGDNVSNLTDLSDVDTTIKTLGSVMFYDSSSQLYKFTDTLRYLTTEWDISGIPLVFSKDDLRIFNDDNNSNIFIGGSTRTTPTSDGASIAIGYQAGDTSNKIYNVAIGYKAGRLEQGKSLAIPGSSIAIGHRAGETEQNSYGTAIGFLAGQANQSTNAISIGYEAGTNNQSANAIAIGSLSGANVQGNEAIAIGHLAGQLNQSTNAISIGHEAGTDTQGIESIAIGSLSGVTHQGNESIAIGHHAGNTSQSTNAISIGHEAGTYIQGTQSIAIGSLSGSNNQGTQSIAIGQNAGKTSQSTNGISIGHDAGEILQGAQGVAIGHMAGKSNQSVNSVAIGHNSGVTTQGQEAVAIGNQSGFTSQGDNSIAIGNRAGRDSLGENSIAIGDRASNVGSSYANTIVLNATGSNCNPSLPSSTYIKPIRSVVQNQTLHYDDTTGEISRSSNVSLANGTGINITGTYPNFTVSSTSSTLGALTDVTITSVADGDLLKYNSTTSAWNNFPPTYLDGAGLYSNYLVKVVNGQAEHTSFAETVTADYTRLQTFIPAGFVSVLAGSIESEIFDTNKTRIHLTSTGINSGGGITVTSDGRVGIGIINPEEDLEVDGSIQIDSANVARLKFQQSGLNPHALGEIDAEQDGNNGGYLQFFTKVDGGSVTEKLRINNQGAIGIEGANFGNSGQVLTSNASGNPVSWADQIDTTYTQGTGVTINASNVISIGQDVGTTDNVEFGIGKMTKVEISSTDNNMTLIDNTYAGTGSYTFVKGLSINGSGNNTDFNAGVVNEGSSGNSYGQVYSNRFLQLRSESLISVEAGTDDIYFWLTAGKYLKLNGTNWTQAPSDDRIKFNETPVSNGLDVINQVNIYKYDKVYELGHTPENDPFKKEVGVIAQEIQQIPELVHAVSVNEVPAQFKDKAPNGLPMSVCYDQIHSYHIKATQELHNLVKTLQTRIEILEGR
tara:strand:- start:537 stop:3626 length:3090 start_codon:yes stop_codon:yes gene_type:complete